MEDTVGVVDGAAATSTSITTIILSVQGEEPGEPEESEVSEESVVSEELGVLERSGELVVLEELGELVVPEEPVVAEESAVPEESVASAESVVPGVPVASGNTDLNIEAVLRIKIVRPPIDLGAPRAMPPPQRVRPAHGNNSTARAGFRRATAAAPAAWARAPRV